MNKKIVLTVDLEEWFHAEVLKKKLGNKRLQRYSRIEKSLERILRLFDRNRVKATFFVLGSIAKKEPWILHALEDRGHEIGSHGYDHNRIETLSPAAFENDLKRSLDVLGDGVGRPIEYYRAPVYSITKKTSWALDILRSNHIKVDSSIYPINSEYVYGWRGFPRDPVRFPNGLIEMPLPTIKIGPMRIPFGAGTYFRIFPGFVTIKAMMTAWAPNTITVNVHPWEFDVRHTEYVKMHVVNPVTRLLHSYAIASNMGKLDALFRSFDVTTIGGYTQERDAETAYPLYEDV